MAAPAGAGVSAWALAREAAARLAAAGIPEDEARFEAEYLARAASGLTRAQYFAGVELGGAASERFTAMVERRLAREPAPYVTGEREFRGLRLAVGSGVLVPRPETEKMIDIALEEAGAGARVFVDVGTGSGAIAVALAKEAPAGTRVLATDVSAVALRFAAANRDVHVAAVALVRCDLASAVARADVVLANLPYIPAGEIDQLEPEVSRWEPRVALDGGNDGYRLIARLIEDCANRLRPRLLALEVGFGQAGDVADMVLRAGAEVSVRKDFTGIERVVCARWA